MKILKYIFFLLLLVFLAFSVFVLTQKSNFNFSKSTFIKVDRITAFKYLNDYRNWEQWSTLIEDDVDVKFIFPDTTEGNSGYYSWKGNSSGKTFTTSLIENKKIIQKTEFSGGDYESILTLKDSANGTVLKWENKGNVDFLSKIRATFSGGIDRYMNKYFSRSINNLKVILNKEINQFKIINSGIITIPARFYVKSDVVCMPSEVQSKINMTLPKIDFFFKNNNVKMNGKPFVIKDFESKDSVKFSVYGPMKEEIFLSNPSDLTVGYMEGFTALKMVLIGDYSHLEVAKAKAITEFNNLKLRPNTTIKQMEVYFSTIEKVKSPSKWQTFIQIPIYTKPIFVPKKYFKKKTLEIIPKIEVAPTTTEPKDEF